MGTNHKQIKSKANAIASAWGTLAGTDSFGGLTLAQFQQLQTDAQNKSATLTTLDAGYTDAMMQRDTAHETLNTAMLNVVDGVKGNTAKYGANSSLYKAMGYVPRNEKASGLTRKSTSTGTDSGTGTTGTTGTPPNGATWDDATGTWDNPGGIATASPTAKTPPAATSGSVKS